MTTAAAPLAVDGAHSPPAPLAWGLSLFIWLLPLHTLAITVLFGGLGLPATTVRLIAGWKELLIATLRLASPGAPA